MTGPGSVPSTDSRQDDAEQMLAVRVLNVLDEHPWSLAARIATHVGRPGGGRDIGFVLRRMWLSGLVQRRDTPRGWEYALDREARS